MTNMQKQLKIGSKKFIKGSIRFSLNSINYLLASIHKKRGLILVEFTPESRSRYPQQHPHSALDNLLADGLPVYQRNYEGFLNFQNSYSDINILDDKSAPKKPNIKNYFYTGLDAFSLYGFLSLYNPKRYVEIGSGNSTKFARQAIDDQDLQTTITSIDPYPRAEIDSLCDSVIREPIEETDLSIFKDLEAGDILFIDSSHYVLQNSDVTVIFMEILPFLKPGVLIHVHDIYLPWDYPPQWVERNYSEQYLLAMLLLCKQPDYEVIFPSYYLSQNSEFQDFYYKNTPVNLQTHIKPQGTSLWLEKKV